MKKSLICFAVLATSAVTVTSVQAAGCGNPRNAFDTVYCAGNLFSQADKSLNQTYSDLRKQLPADQQNMLKKSQLSWIKDRDAKCSREESNGYFVNLDCAVTMTQDRSEFLKERQRECSSTGCEASKLAE
ncbi:MULTISPECIES: lysozyme inhibitor LprI family protein [Pseudomonas syringae group]|uniref:DUF1311 domain-containing protein n=2 Tax=Pseudomonas syringae group TaxID=136849 RepID=A0ABX6HD00_9PSED|nr:lysozyme inhibitor LprI family protein [Pseudomonas asturiensis]QHF03420.1 DUF1311 domain-containing protein [Pseudomonas asturiensis]